MTQAELCRAAGMPRSTLANMLSPTATPRVVHVGQMVKIAVAMGIDPRIWIGEIEAFERRRRDAAAGARAAPGRPAPQVQKRAARSRSGAPPTGDE